MILSMKVISLGFDLDKKEALEQERNQKKEEKDSEENDPVETSPSLSNKRTRRRRNVVSPEKNEVPEQDEAFELQSGTMPSLLEFMGYAFCPGTCVFGPWTKFEDYLRLYNTPIWVRHQNLILINIYFPCLSRSNSLKRRTLKNHLLTLHFCT